MQENCKPRGNAFGQRLPVAALTASIVHLVYQVVMKTREEIGKHEGDPTPVIIGGALSASLVACLLFVFREFRGQR